MTDVSSHQLVTIFGGSGFVGRHLVRQLAKSGYRIRVAVRRPDLAGHLQPLGGVGQIQFVQANLRYPGSVAAACRGADVVVNLVGILWQSGKQQFDAVQGEGAGVVARAARDAGARLVHISSLSADAESPSDYARSKAKGEALVREVMADAIIMRPSILFGPEDGFFNKFAAMAMMSPVLPAIGGGLTRFQPVYVVDVAKAITRAIEGAAGAGKTYELGGPEVVTFRQALEIMLEAINRKRMFISIPWWIARIQGRIFGLMPKPLLTLDQVRLLQSDNIVSDDAEAAANTLEGLGIPATNMRAILPSYLVRFRPHGQYGDRSTVNTNGR